MKNKLIATLTMLTVMLHVSCIQKSKTTQKDLDVNKKEFLFGVSTSAYQVEGNYNKEGKGESKWDFLTNKVGVTQFVIGEKQTANVSANMYNREQYLKDLKLLKDMGANSYRFSLDWSRIIPDGVGKVNELAIEHYSKLIDDVKSFDLEPVVTLYHFDFPMALVKQGGWDNSQMINWYENYVSVVFDRLGSKVNYFITFNEPYIEFLVFDYLSNDGVNNQSQSERFANGYKKGLNQIIASAKAIQIYKSMGLKGKIGITLNLSPTYPLNPESNQDKIAANFQDKLLNTAFLDPVLKGEYPKQVKDSVQKYVPEFNPDQNTLAFLKANTPDFLGVNFYAPALVKSDKKAPFSSTWLGNNTDEVKAHNGVVSPKDLYKVLMRLKTDYNNPTVLITENGASFENDDVKQEGKVNDPLRTDYIERHVKAALDAKKEGANLIGYMAWSGWDNFEWVFGYTARYGLIYVDFETQQRIPKESYYKYKALITSVKGLSVN
ncbi:glycoside hydrolase family 1 protein [Formosa sp. S-31]|uniref:glycoside hydrolase family 1 protein n=1 Tax=Formosa sp. S-31 TaxID=2790949 RepID=UPI003EBD9138